MNKVYKVVWNVTLGTWTAVSELAKGKSKTSSFVNNQEQALSIQKGKMTASRPVWPVTVLAMACAFSSFTQAASFTAGGGTVTDSVNGIGILGTSSGRGAVAVGGASKTGGGQSVAVGYEAYSTGDQSVAVGANTRALGASSIAIGGDDLNTVAGTNNNTAAAITYNKLTGDNLIRVYDGATGANNQYYGTTTGAGSVAIGVQAGALGDLSTAFGTRTQANGIAATALGVGATASLDGSVALGAGSQTDLNATKVTNATIENVTLANFVGSAGFAGDVSDKGRQVSVGNVGSERQIKNVAPGEISSKSTDAINGSQLNALATVLSDAIGAKVTPEKDPQGNIITDSVTGNANYIIDNLGGTGKNNINDAIQYVNNAAEEAQTTANKGFALKAQDGASIQKALGDAVDVVGADSNITTKVANGQVQIELADSINVDSITAGGNTLNASGLTVGNTTVTSTGLTIANGPSMTNTGINAGNKVISSMAAGNVAAGSTDAVNGSQLYQTNQNVTAAQNAADAAQATADKGIKLGDGKTSTAYKLGDTINVKGDSNVTSTTTADGVQLALAKDIAVDSMTAGSTTINSTGLTIANGPSMTNTGINAGNKVISSVAAGNVAAGSTDAVNGSQLYQTNQNVTAAQNAATNAQQSADAAQTTANKGFALKAQDGLTVQKALGDAVDVVGADSNITTKVANNQVQIELADNISVDSLTAGGNTLNASGLTVGNTAVTSAGLTIVNGPSMTNTGINAGNKVISDVAEGNVSAASKDAVNGSQLYNAQNNVANVIGGNAAVNNAGDVTVSNIGGTGKNTISEAVAAAKTTVTQGDNIVVTPTTNADGSVNYEVKTAANMQVSSITAGNALLSNDGLTIISGPSVVTSGINAGGKVISHVADGSTLQGSTEAVNGGQLYDLSQTIENLKIAALDPSDVFLLSSNGNDETSISKGDKIDIGTANSEKNIKVNKSLNTIDFSLNPDLDVTSVSAGGTIVDNKGVHFVQQAKLDDQGNPVVDADGNPVYVQTPSISRTGIDAGNTVITNVKDGAVNAISKDAVNGSQLNTTNINVTNAQKAADAAQATADQGISFGDGKTANNYKLGSTLNVKGDSNVSSTTTADGVQLGLAKNIAVDSVTAGNSVLNTDGLSFTDSTGNPTGPSITQAGIDAGDKVISNVAAATLSATSKEAVNGSQLFETNTKVTQNTTDINVLKKGFNLKTNGADQTAVLAGDTIDIGTAATEKNLKVAKVGNTIDFSLNPNLTVDSVTAGSSLLNNDGLSIANGPSVLVSGIDAADKKITNVANGDVNTASKDAVNGSQLYNAQNNVASIIGGNTVIDPNTGAVTASDIGGTGKNTISEAVAAAKTTVSQGKNMVVTPSQNADGSTNYEVKTSDYIDAVSFTAGNTSLNNNGLSILNGPSVTAAGINANNTKIVNVANGAVNAASQDAVNGSQLFAVDDRINQILNQNIANLEQGFSLTANGQNTAAVVAGATIDVGTAAGESNLTVSKAGNVIDFALNPDLNLTSVTTGGTLLNNDGLSLSNGPQVLTTGINAGKKKITNVAKGDVTAASEDAVNGSQLYNAQNNVANVIGGNTSIDPNTGAITANDIGGTGKNTISEAVAAAKTTVTEGKNITVQETQNADGSSNYEVATAENLDVISLKAGNTLVNNNGLTINNGPSVTISGIDAGSKKITNVANGDVNASSSDAVNGSQLYAVDNRLNDIINKNINALEQGFKLTADGKNEAAVVAGETIDIGTAAAEKNLTVVKTGNTIDFALNQDLSLNSVNAAGTVINNNGLSFQITDAQGNVQTVGPAVSMNGINAGDLLISNVADGSISAASKDAVNGSQLYSAQNNVANVIGGNTSIDPNSGVIVANNIGGTGKNTIDEAVAAAKTVVKQGDNIVVDESKDPVTGNSIYTVKTAQDLKVTSVTAGNSLLNNDGLTLANGPSVLVSGIDAADKKITHVAKGDVTDASEDAVNGSQLYNAQNNVANIIGGNTVIDPATGSVSTSNIGGTGKNTIDEAIKASTTMVSQGKNMVVTPSKNADGSTNYEVKTSDYIDAVSFTAGNTSLSNNGLSILNGPSVLVSGINAGGSAITNVAAGQALTDAVNVGQLNAVDSRIDQILNQNIANLNQGFKLSANGQKEAAVVAGATIDIGTADSESNLTVSKAGNVIDFALNPNLILTSVTAGGTLLNNDGLSIANGPQVLTTGINAGKKKITNVAKGDVTAASEDAVNGSQLYNAQNNVANVIGGNTSIDPNTGAITANDIGGTGKNTVSEAVAAAKTVVKQGDNIVVDESKDPITGNSIYTVKTAQDLKVNSLAAGNTLVNNNGVTISNGPSLTIAGIDAADKKIINVAKGAVTSTSKDAVNGSQLYNAQSNVANVLGGNTSIDPNTGAITANNIGGTGKNTVNEAVAAAKTEVVEGKNIVVKETKDPATGHSIYEVSTDENLKVTSLQAGNTLVNNNGLVINNGPSVTVSGINAGGKKITNVANGDVTAVSSDAVNGSQLYAIDTRLNDIINKNINSLEKGFSLSANGNNTGAVVAGETIDIGTDINEKNLTVSKSGNIIDFALNPDLVVDSVTAGSSVFNTSGLNLKDAYGATTVIGSNGSIVMSSGGNTVALNAATGDLTGLSNKTLGGGDFAQSGRAATEEQLNAAQSNLTSILGGNAANNGGVVSMSNIGGTGENTIDAAIKSVNQIANNANQGWTVSTNGNQATASNVKPGNTVDFKNTDGNVVIANQGNNLTVNLNKDLDLGSTGSFTAGDTKMDDQGLTIAGGPSVTKDGGVNAGNNQVSNVADGRIAAGSKDAVNGGQIHDMMGAGAYDSAGNLSNIGGTGANNINDAITAVNKNVAASKVSVKAGSDNVTVTANAAATEYTVDISKDLNVDSVTAKDLKADTITAGDTTINSNGLTIKDGPSITASGVDAGNKAVSNVSNGVQNSDAVNMGQLAQYLGGGAGYNNITQSFDAPNYEVNGGSYNNVGDALGALNQADQALDNRITNLGDQLQQAFYSTNKRIDDVEKKANAGIAAAMALENAPYIPGKYTYAAGAAYHGGENAVGVTLRKTADNGRWSLTGGVAAGSSGDPSVRVGISGVID